MNKCVRQGCNSENMKSVFGALLGSDEIYYCECLDCGQRYTFNKTRWEVRSVIEDKSKEGEK